MPPTTSAKYPAALLAITDVNGEAVNLGELQLDGDLSAIATTIPVRTAIPTTWPSSGKFTIDSEIIAYGSYSGSTFSSCTRGQETSYYGGTGSGAGASHSSGAVVGLYATALQWNQLVRDVIATQTTLGTGFNVKGADLTCAATIVPGTDGNYFDVTGSTGPVTAITPASAWAAGRILRLKFSSTPTLTHNGTSLILMGAANYVCVAGDVITFMSLGSGNWREIVRFNAAMVAAQAQALASVRAIYTSTPEALSGSGSAGNSLLAAAGNHVHPAVTSDPGNPTVTIIPWAGVKSTNGGAMYFNQSSAWVTGAEAGFTPSAQNDAFNWDIVLPAGTYTFTMISRKSTDRGIYTIQLDGVSVGTIDGYDAAGPTANVVSTITGITVGASSSARAFKVLMATKNASSSGYQAFINIMTWIRTGA